jgi:hypothetical protein
LAWLEAREVTMSKEGLSFEAWLAKARLRRERLSARQVAVLEAALGFLEHGGHDYASRRWVEHFLLHADVGLKVAQVARLVGVDRCTSSRHRPCSSSQVAAAIQNRLAGKFPGKLLPRYAGPVAQFLLEHPHATRDEVLGFLEQRWQIRPGYRALDNFLRKYGLDRGSLRDRAASAVAPARTEVAAAPVSTEVAAAPVSTEVAAAPARTPAASTTAVRVLTPSSRNLLLPPPAHFFLPARSTPGRS